MDRERRHLGYYVYEGENGEMITIPLEEYKRKKREKLKRNIATIIRNHTIESSKHYIPSRETAEKILKLIEEER